MKTIAIPKEMKSHEYRLALMPEQVLVLSKKNVRILLESGAGEGIGLSDQVYEEAGAEIISETTALYKEADLILKVKEPTSEELAYFKEGQTLFCFLHLAANPELATFLIDRKITAIAFESIALDDGTLPILKPMSQIAGALAVQEGAKYLTKLKEGRGLLLSGIEGLFPASVLILGAGNAGSKAAEVALGMGAMVTVLDVSKQALSQLKQQFPKLTVHDMSEGRLLTELKESDLVIGTVLIPDQAAPKVIKKDHLAVMKKGAVIVDVSVDQGGCCETTRPSTHEDPVYVVDGVLHYAVSNMPGIVPLTASQALSEVTFPYVQRLLERPISTILAEDSPLRRGIYSHDGLSV